MQVASYIVYSYVQTHGPDKRLTGESDLVLLVSHKQELDCIHSVIVLSNFVLSVPYRSKHFPAFSIRGTETLHTTYCILSMSIA